VEKRVIKYIATPTGARFHKSDAFVRGVMGPVRSGKSTMMSAEIFRRMNQQSIGSDGRRRSRWVVVRNTYRELEDTTIKTWLDWWPQEIFGPFNFHSMLHRVYYEDVEAEVLFRALDRPKDVAKLLSMEVTGAWVNEAREIPKAVIDTLTDRVGQYPAKKDGGATWYGVMMDTNPPDDDHWWYELSEVTPPEERPNWEFYKQPGGLIEREERFYANEHAENINNLNEGHDYYLTRLAGKGKDYVRVYYCAQYGFVKEGKPVHPDYVDSVHCAKEIIIPNKRYIVYVGLDFGLTPAAVFGQRYPNGRWVWIDELVTDNMGASKFGKELNRKIQREYKDFKFEFYGDPAGDDRVQTDEQTVYQILSKHHIDASPVWTNDTTIRREAVAEPLRRLMDGKPGLMISPKCKITRKGLAGGFCYKRLQVAGAERYHENPDKNRYSHPVEAGEYMMIGAGEGYSVVESADDGIDYPEKAETEYDEFAVQAT
jgi:hypothetical protein